MVNEYNEKLWRQKAESAARRHGCYFSNPQFDTTIDDVNHLPRQKTKVAKMLATRCMGRFAEFLSQFAANSNPVFASMCHEASNGITMIWIAEAMKAETHGSSKLLITADRIFHCLNDYDNLLEGDGPRIELQNMVNEAFEEQTREAIESLHSLLVRNKKCVEDSLGLLSGVLDEKPNRRDTALDGLLRELHGLFISVEPPAKQEDRMDLSRKAESWFRTYPLSTSQTDKRLGLSLHNAKLGKEIVESLYDLAMPQLTVNTFVRFIRIFPQAKMPHILYGLPGTSTITLTPPEEGTRTHISKNGSGNFETSMLKARQSLPYAEQDVPIDRLVPMEKKYALQLLAFLYSTSVPQSDTACYSLFGYGACKTRDDMDRLNLIYTKLLVESDDKTEAFDIFVKATLRYDLISLMDRQGCRRARQDIPDLVKELSDPFGGKESVWVLKAFLRRENESDPPDCLIRDFGFHLCTMRDEVLSLKSIYNHVLRRCSILTLHKACMAGKLQDLVISCGVQMTERQQRLVGFQNTDYAFSRKKGFFFTSTMKQAHLRNDYYKHLAQKEFELDRSKN